MNSLTHINEDGSAVMVDISDKDITRREAIAVGYILMSSECFNAVVSGDNKKGSVLGTARIAGIMAAKRTSELIPLCHPLRLNKVSIEFTSDINKASIGDMEFSSSVSAGESDNSAHDKRTITAVCTVSCTERTGAEMEALTGVSVALLTIYDMCKALDSHMEISGIHVVKKIKCVL